VDDVEQLFDDRSNGVIQALTETEAEATSSWVRYFVHVGHLVMGDGGKMSKSAGNSVTIREALSKCTPRQLRMMFALTPRHRSLTYGDSFESAARCRERDIRNFFQNVEAATRSAPVASKLKLLKEEEGHASSHHTPGPEERLLRERLTVCRETVDAALHDDLDTSSALRALAFSFSFSSDETDDGTDGGYGGPSLVRAVTSYLSDCEKRRRSPHVCLVRACAAYVRDVLAVMGIEDDAACLGTSVRLDTDAIMDTLASFRADVRTIARSESTGATTKKELLTACDRVRDKTLNELGVRLEDKAGGESTWKRG